MHPVYGIMYILKYPAAKPYVLDLFWVTAALWPRRQTLKKPGLSYYNDCDLRFVALVRGLLPLATLLSEPGVRAWARGIRRTQTG